MDRTSIFFLVACFALLFLGSRLIDKLYPPVPLPPGARNATNATHAATSPALSNLPPVLAPADPTRAVAPIAPLAAVTALLGPEQTLVITNTNARYTFTSRGGGLRTIELIQYPETISRKKTAATTRDFATLNTPDAAPVMELFGGASLQDDAPFTLSATADGARAEKTLTNGLRLVKEFHLSTNYLVLTKTRLENT